MWVLNGLHIGYVRGVGWGGLRSRRKQFFRRPWRPLAWTVQIHWRHDRDGVEDRPPMQLSIQLFQQPQLPYGRITSLNNLRVGGLTSPRRQQQRCRHIEGFYSNATIDCYISWKFYFFIRTKFEHIKRQEEQESILEQRSSPSVIDEEVLYPGPRTPLFRRRCQQNWFIVVAFKREIQNTPI